MSYDKNKVIAVAEAEVGYLEKATNSDLDDKTANAGSNNYTKYARDLAAYPFYNGSKTGVAWCDVFVDWCFVQAYGLEAAKKLTCQTMAASKNCGAGCKYSRQYYQNNGQLFASPEPGDQIFFYSSDKSSISHTGLVYKVDSSYVYTIEGNTSSASGVVANGGAVAKKKYALSYARLAGFGRPDWDMDGDAEESSAASGTTSAPATPDSADSSSSSDTASEGTVTIVSNGGSVNVRVGNGTNYSRITSVKPGKTYPWVATAANGWNAIVISNRVGWVSGQYSQKS